LHAKRPGDSVQLIEVEALAAPCVRQRFEGDVEAGRVPEAEAVGHGVGELRGWGVLLPVDGTLYSCLFSYRGRQA
jgi:hypothetical protein